MVICPRHRISRCYLSQLAKEAHAYATTDKEDPPVEMVSCSGRLPIAPCTTSQPEPRHQRHLRLLFVCAHQPAHRIPSFHAAWVLYKGAHTPLSLLLCQLQSARAVFFARSLSHNPSQAGRESTDPSLHGASAPPFLLQTARQATVATYMMRRERSRPAHMGVAGPWARPARRALARAMLYGMQWDVSVVWRSAGAGLSRRPARLEIIS
jgi:hypothetical protein